MQKRSDFVSPEIDQINSDASCAIVLKSGAVGSGCLVNGQDIGMSKYCILTSHHVLKSTEQANTAHAMLRKQADVSPSEKIEVRTKSDEGFAAGRPDKDMPLDSCIVAVDGEDTENYS